MHDPAGRACRLSHAAVDGRAGAAVFAGRAERRETKVHRPGHDLPAPGRQTRRAAPSYDLWEETGEIGEAPPGQSPPGKTPAAGARETHQ